MAPLYLMPVFPKSDVTSGICFWTFWYIISWRYIHMAHILLSVSLETFWNATVTVTDRGVRRLWRHRLVCIWNAPNPRPNRKCQHMMVNAADNRMRFTVSGYAKFQWIFHENDIHLLYSNKQYSQSIPPIHHCVCKIIFEPIDLTYKFPDFINLSKYKVTLGMRPSHEQRCVPMETPRTDCEVSKNHLSMSAVTFTCSDDVTCCNCNCKCIVSKCPYCDLGSGSFSLIHQCYFINIGAALPLDCPSVIEIPQCSCPISNNVPFCDRNVHISVTKWDIVGYLCNALWDLWDWSTKSNTTKMKWN